MKTERPVILHARGIVGAGGGPEKTIANSPRFLSAGGYDCLCAYMHPPNDPGFSSFKLRAERAGAPILPVTDSGPFDLSLVRTLIHLCREHHVDVWHAHDYKTDVLGLIIRRFWPMKLVTTVHGWVQVTRRTRIYYAIDRRVLRFYDHVIAVSDDLRDECARFGVNSDRLTLVPNGIDTDRYRPGGGPKMRKASTLTIGAVGRLAPEKGFDVLIKSVAKLVGQGCQLKLKIAGEGSEGAALHELCSTLGLHKHVDFMGQVEDMQSFYSMLDIFALSSFREGLPNVVLEAMAMGVPVVSTTVAGIPQLIEDQKTGALVQAGSVDELAEAIRHLTASAETRRLLARNARGVVVRDFDFGARMQKVMRIYDRLLNRLAEPGEIRENARLISNGTSY